MSSDENQVPSSPTEAAGDVMAATPELSRDDAAVRAGAILRSYREASGLHIAALSVALKVPVPKLEALEQGQFQRLPGITFTRSLAAAVCRHLKADARPVLDLLPAHEAQPFQHAAAGINTPFHKPGDLVSVGEAWRRARPTAYAVIALLLAALLLYSFPAQWLKPMANPSSPQTAASAPVDRTQTEVIESLQVPPIPVASLAAVEPVPTQSAPEASAPVPAAALAPVPGAGVTLSFHAEDDTWVEVQNRDKQIVMKRLIKAGETQFAQGQPPLNVSVGNAGKTKVQVQGKPFDLAAVTRENVARFTIQGQ